MRYSPYLLFCLLLSAYSENSAAEEVTFFRGLNLNGPQVLIDGNEWEGADSTNYTCNDSAFEKADAILIPPTDPERAKMIRSSRWNGNRVELTHIPAGTYSLFLYVWEDNNSETFEISVNGNSVGPRIRSGKAGEWQKLGPWHVDVTTDKIELSSRGGAANFSGIELWRGKHPGDVEPEITDEQLTFFETKIRPLLIKHCYECHSSESDDLQGGLLVDSRPTLQRGGHSGPAIVPRDVEHSLLIRAIRYEPGLEMPPAEKLSIDEITDLEQWVQMGAPDPRSDATRFVRKRIDVDEARQFWSLRPVMDPPAPILRNADWPYSEIDRFIGASLEANQLMEPVQDADKYTLIRRATYDLTGLAPTPAEVKAFIEDDSPHAFAAVVDRLLASTHYGERWGRHWMDLVRYADTAGDNSDYPVPQAFLYRNYIIDSINADKPYNQFIREQVAGDLLPAESEAQRNEQTIATGYLAISRRFGSVIEDYPQHLTIEDTLDNIGRTLLGMTITCARCHDHKFDPLSQDDYYGLYGIFESTQYPFPGIELDKTPRDFVPMIKDGNPSEQFIYGMAEGRANDAYVHVRGEPKQRGDVIPRRFPEVLGGYMLSVEDARQSGRIQLAEWLTAGNNPLTVRVMVNRIWQYHFGSGLVKTPSDFGKRGLPPTHPELLDWLASRFIEDGWSLKSLHRRIMLSRTYQLSSQCDESLRAAQRDPDNKLHWRFNRQRLDAESLRDTLLQMSDELDRVMPREPHPFPPSDQWQYTQHHPFRDSYDSTKRSVYLMMARLNARPFFTTFDGADQNASTANRDSSVTTIQSLYLMNDPFVHACAEKIADRLMSHTNSTEARISHAFELLLGRPPENAELQNAHEWIEQLEQEFEVHPENTEHNAREIWSAFVRVMIRTNQFLYVD